MKRLSGLLSAMLLLLLSFPNYALAANNARDYLPLEPGTKVLMMYFDMQSGNEYYRDSDKLSSDMDLESTVSFIRPIYYTELWGITVVPQFLLPFGSVELNGSRSSGIGDLRLACGTFPINDKENKFLDILPS